MHRWIFAIALLVQSTALAQAAPSSAARDEAADRFERGVELFREQAFRAALVEFQRAYDLAPDYRLLYNLARTKHHLQDYLGATQNYEAYLSGGGSDIPAERRAQVESTLSSLRSRVGRIEVKVNRPRAEVFVDDAKVGTSPLAQLVLANVGRHRVSARGADGSVASEFVDVAGGDIANVNLVLVAAEVARSRPAGDEEAPWSLQRKIALTSWITGGAMLGSGLVTGILSLRAMRDFDEQVDRLGASPDEVDELRTRADRLSLSTDLLVAFGAAAAVTGTALWIFGPSHEERVGEGSRARLKLDVGPRSLALSGRF